MNRMMGVALALAGAAIVGGCAIPVDASQASAAAPTTTAVPVALSPEEGFLKAAGESGLTWNATVEQKLTFARSACELAATGTSREGVLKMMTQWERGPAETMLDLATSHLCPTTPWMPEPEGLSGVTAQTQSHYAI